MGLKKRQGDGVKRNGLAWKKKGKSEADYVELSA